MAPMASDRRVPSELWPEFVYTIDGLRAPERVNLATCLVDVHVAEGRGEHPAILAGDRSISYAELQRMVNRAGRALAALGVAPGDRVALRLPNSPDFVALWLGIQKIGAVAVSTMPMLRARELAYVVNDSQPKVVVCASDLIDELARARAAFTSPATLVVARRPKDGADARLPPGGDLWLDEAVRDASADLDPWPSGRDDLALIAYTSGSTGVPKGATHAPGDILASADTYARYVLRPSPSDRFGGHPTLAFTFGLGGLLVFPFRFGATTVLLDQFTPPLLMEAVGRQRVTILFCAATTYRLLLQDPLLEQRYDLSSLHTCVSAGETLPASVFEEWKRRTGVEILDGLGSTEMFHIFISATHGAARAGATGTPVPGYEARVLSDALEEVPRGTQGLLAVKGPTGCRYWNQPERQRDYVRGGWNLTGDLYVQDEDGQFRFECRHDDLIICGGYNIAGPEVEDVLLQHPAVLEAAVVASPDEVRGFVPKAFIVLKQGVTGSDELAHALQEHVKAELAPYKYPRRIAFVPALPRTETGKVRRAVLREQEREAGQGLRTSGT